MTQDARTLQLILQLCGRSLKDFQPKPLPKTILRFLDGADRCTLQNCLVEALCRLENLPAMRKSTRPRSSTQSPRPRRRPT